MSVALPGNESRDLARHLIDRYFRTVSYPYTRHHVDSYDQFLQQDMISIIRSQNPIVILKDLLNSETNQYKYRVEIEIGGQKGESIKIGTPTISLQNGDEVRVMYPNEARLRNLTYASSVYADISVKITYTTSDGESRMLTPEPILFTDWQLFKIPIMLHSRYCILNAKPKEFLREAGECPYDNGGYFIVDGSEKILITRQEQAFNTLYITPQENPTTEPKIAIYASIECLSAQTRQVKRVSIMLMRHIERNGSTSHATIQVTLPFVRKPIPLFTLFRALGFQSDEEIVRMIFPDFDSSEAKLLMSKLQPSILEGFPFLNTFTAVNYIKTLTKGFSEAHVLDILHNKMFIHMPNDPTSQALFLGDCVRRILRVSEGYDGKTDRDDTRNQRCLTSGFLIQELFNNSYKLWVKAFCLTIDKEYNYNKDVLYKDENFKNIFQQGNASKIFMSGLLNDMIMKGFKGKWGTGLGEEKSGVLQAMSRLSYIDFMSHCRRVILDFDTGMKLTGPRKLHTSQYGYFCTSETPTGASIGITKNMSIMTALSTSSQTNDFFEWLRSRGGVYAPSDITLGERIQFVPVYVNGGMFGYTAFPKLLTDVVKLFKRTGCLPYSVSVIFSIRDRKVYIYMDAGRPLRPLIWLGRGGQIPVQKLKSFPTWRYLVMGRLDARKYAELDSTDFFDPLKERPGVKLSDYPALLEPHTGAIEYIDPYEQNEAFIANNSAYITPETTHVEVHPSTIMSMMTTLIPFAPHNQSPRNQLSCSQSKQGVSIYATNWRNRFDNTAHVLCYGEMPLSRTIYNNYLGEGKMAYGMNCILAIACWSGYNQEDGIVMNYDAVQRGMFRSMAFRSYEAFEEDDERANTRVRFGNPAQIAAWKELGPGLDYSKLDDRGIIREGEYVDETTVIVGAYMMSTTSGQIKDASVTPQVWTRGRVEKVVILVNNLGMRLVKIRVVQDRIPELGDKFCLSPDHDVLTEEGWKPIANVTLEDKVLTKVGYAHPTERYVFDHTGPMFYVKTDKGSLYVTGDHRLFVHHMNGTAHFVRTAELIQTAGDRLDDYSMETPEGEFVQIQSIRMSATHETGDKVYCLSVPSEIFAVRRQQEITAFWTGNSNRHGQKGTIGALLRGHDMPRTIAGIVPDMIMNPHAIPSRMTIAQNLEQLLGKTAALAGAIGDGTAFMNDGSPQEAIGGILEQVGFEKYGNEVLYNGATGEQIQAAIFIGPVYGMRLKHMVEDKWQARGKGRKEVRTHQPTGGRGAQGGLKIGEMDRDAIIAHGVMSFVKESYMERSDGTTIPLCVACGMIPIYNPRLGLAVCSYCDGPLKYMGDRASNLELLPPLGRPKSKIVRVEMPYSTKLLTQEQETFLNISMRYITTSGIQRLAPLEFSGKTSEVLTELKPFYLSDVIAVPTMRLEKTEEELKEELRSQQASLEDEKKKIEEQQVIVDLEEPSEEPVIQLVSASPMVMVQPMQPMQQVQMQPMQQMQQPSQQMEPMQVQMQPPQQVQMQQLQPQMEPMQVQMQQPQMQQPQMQQPQMQQPPPASMIPSATISSPDGMVGPSSGGAVIAVSTSQDDFFRDGLYDGMNNGMGGRMPRRNPYRRNAEPMMGGAAPMNFSFARNESAPSAPGPNVPIMITKLE